MRYRNEENAQKKDQESAHYLLFLFPQGCHYRARHATPSRKDTGAHQAPAAILMIFEMTHQFGMVPALMLGTLISQAVARLAGHSNFYEEVLLQDGHENGAKISFFASRFDGSAQLRPPFLRRIRRLEGEAAPSRRLS
jgi:hypothetical protein